MNKKFKVEKMRCLNIALDLLDTAVWDSERAKARNFLNKLPLPRLVQNREKLFWVAVECAGELMSWAERLDVLSELIEQKGKTKKTKKKAKNE